MPRLTNECQDLAMQMGEAIGGDVTTWDVAAMGLTAELRITTRDGKDFVCWVRKIEPREAAE